MTLEQDARVQRAQSGAGPLHQLRTSEWMLLVYLFFTSLIALIRLPTQPAIRWVLIANVLSAVLVWLFAWGPLGRIGRALRELYPLVLLGALYPAIEEARK